MYEIKIYYSSDGYKCKTFHPATLDYGEVLSLMAKIVALWFNTTNIKWLTVDQNWFVIWIDRRCKGCVIIEEVGPATSAHVLESGG